MSEEERSRLGKLVSVFGYGPGVELDSGTVLVRNNARPGAYEVQVSEEGAVDVVDVDQFKSVRELDRYLQRLEDTTPEADGVGVA